MKTLPFLASTLLFSLNIHASPSSSDWATLSRTFGKNFVTDIRPPAAPCHKSSYNASQCAEAVSLWQNSAWRSSQIGAMQTTTWEQLNGQWCDIPTNGTGPLSSPCPQGNVPFFGINVTTVSDVSEAVKFASAFHLPLVIKNTGHDYAGRSSDPNRLLIWTHYMKNISVGAYEVCGINHPDTITVGAGVQWGEAYHALNATGRVVPGGADPDVGASGGQVMGGGHSPLSNTYGLTPDNVLEFEVVTLDGQIRKVNQCSNPDLFWALRGGGGGTYAIVTSTTFQTYADTPTAFAYWNYTDTSSGFAQGLSHFGKYAPSLAEMGWSGYFYGVSGTFYGFAFIPLVNSNLTNQTTTESFMPFLQDLNNTQGLNFVFGGVATVPSFQHILSGTLTAAPTGYRGLLASRLIPKSSLQDPTQRTRVASEISAVRNDTLGISILGHFVGGGATSKPSNFSSAVLPAWRKAVWHVAFSANPPVDASKEQLDQTFQAITDRLEPLRKLTPGSGAYMNEANARAPEWKEDFFGENYEKLLAIKKKWDPKGLLRCNECVGSDHL